MLENIVVMSLWLASEWFIVCSASKITRIGVRLYLLVGWVGLFIDSSVRVSED